MTLVLLQGHLEPAGTEKPSPPQLMLALTVCLLKQEVGTDSGNTGSWSLKGYCLHTAEFTLYTHLQEPRGTPRHLACHQVSAAKQERSRLQSYLLPLRFLSALAKKPIKAEL